MEKLLLIGSCLVAFIGMCGVGQTLRHIEEVQVKTIGAGCLIFIFLRYVTLTVYSVCTDLKILEGLRYFYYTGSVALMLFVALALWYSLPFLRDKIKIENYFMIYLPWIAFFTVLLVGQPTKLIEGTAFGCELVINAPYNEYVRVAQWSLIGVFLVFGCIGMGLYKHLQIRVQIIVILLAQGLLGVESLGQGQLISHYTKAYTITEIFALWTIYYALTYSIKHMKREQYTTQKNAS